MSAYKYIWKTWKTHDIPKKFRKLHQSWITKNPDFQMKLYNDEQCLNYITNHFNAKIIQTYQALPLGVMKADFWRYLMVFKNGGYYCDIDSQCNVPLSSWLPKDARFVAAKEHEFYFVQWAFYSEPHHKILEYVIDLICDKILNEGIDLHYQIGNNKKYDTFVHYYTGPFIWTEAILKYVNELLGIKIQTSEELNEAQVNALKEKGIYIYEFDYFSELNHHLAASCSGFIRNYTSWRKEIKKKHTFRSMISRTLHRTLTIFYF